MPRHCFGQALVGLDQNQARNCFENAAVIELHLRMQFPCLRPCSGTVCFPGMSLAAGNDTQNFRSFFEVGHTTAGT